MDDLVTWLRAQLDEDERTARAVTDADWREDVAEDYPGINEFAPEVQAHIARHDPARVLREVEAKRRILDWCVEVIGDRDLSRYGEPGLLKDDPDALAVTLAVETIRNLAAGMSDQPGLPRRVAPVTGRSSE